MSPIAQLLLAKGHTISGSDAKASGNTETLQQAGATVFIGQAAEQVPPDATVVYSTAVKPGNPEYDIAVQRQQPVWHRSQALAFLMQHDWQHSIGLSGTHGKTTMTGMVGCMLKAAEQDPTVIAGGRLPGSHSNLWAPEGNQVVAAELDESDGTIVRYQPSITVITNLELDHADHYQDGESGLLETFRTFLAQLNDDGKPHTLILNAACQNSRTLATELPPSIRQIWVCPTEAITPPEGNFESLVIGEICPSSLGGLQAQLEYQSLETDKTPLGMLALPVPGDHNIVNASMAVGVGLAMGLDLAACLEGLKSFTGMGRRFEQCGNHNGAVLFDDYGHHPTEIRATLQAARQYMSAKGLNGRLQVVFQPHRFSRLKAFLTEFADSLTEADTVWTVPVYSAGEAFMEGACSKTLADQVQALGTEAYYSDSSAPFIELAQALRDQAKSGDFIFSMGAGDITKLWG